MATLRVVGVRLAAACVLGLTPLMGHGSLEVASPAGPERLHRGDSFAIQFELDADTLLDTFQFTPDYQSFANILQLTANPKLTPDIASGSGLCNQGMCTFFYIPARSIRKGTVVAQWNFRVTDDAPIGPFAFDLQLFVNGEHIQFPQTVQFNNVVPEPAIWLSLVAGFVVLCARGARRFVGEWNSAQST
jgi:hypothetical protein